MSALRLDRAHGTSPSPLAGATPVPSTDSTLQHLKSKFRRVPPLKSKFGSRRRFSILVWTGR